MNATKTMLKAVILTQLMQSVETQGRKPKAEEIAAVEAVNAELASAGEALIIGQTIDEAFLTLLAAVDSIPEEV